MNEYALNQQYLAAICWRHPGKYIYPRPGLPRIAHAAWACRCLSGLGDFLVQAGEGLIRKYRVNRPALAGSR
ncbi:MAG: hypothetical protein FJZ96_03175 [Chloroflexi bacterium]|nr:hypothetical protein [Chloroflexota bacterium]